MRKRLLFLGGSYFQIPPLIYARRQGYYIITCDYLPDNPGHQYADEYHNVSTTDMEAVLNLSRRLYIDGIVAYGSDPAATTAAYVAEKLNLPGNPYHSVCILSRKDLFREFLKNNRFNVPAASSFSLLEDAMVYMQNIHGPVIIKPVDSSGSKGVTTISSADQLPAAFKYAMSFSRARVIIIEEFINRKGYQVAGDGFVLDGKLVFRCFAQEHFFSTGNPFVPVGESFPLLIPAETQAKIHHEVDRLMSLLNMKVGGLNFDIILNEDDKVYLMEVAARSGGNIISEVIKYSTGTDLAKFVVDGALGLDCSGLTMYDRAAFYSVYILHAEQDGLFHEVEIRPSIQANLVEQMLFVKEGMPVKAYRNSSDSLGYLVLRFESADDMITKMESMRDLVHVRVSKAIEILIN